MQGIIIEFSSAAAAELDFLNLLGSQALEAFHDGGPSQAFAFHLLRSEPLDFALDLNASLCGFMIQIAEGLCLQMRQ